MDNKDFPKVRKAAKRQGWIVEPTTHGEMFFSPDGRSKALWHYTVGPERPEGLRAPAEEGRLHMAAAERDEVIV